jgi:hypothetical protein
MKKDDDDDVNINNNSHTNTEQAYPNDQQLQTLTNEIVLIFNDSTIIYNNVVACDQATKLELIINWSDQIIIKFI